MKRVLISISALALVFSMVAMASDGSECSEAAKKACASAKTKAGCCATKTAHKSSAMADQVSADAAVKAEVSSAGAHVCPDVAGKTALQEFHESMHPLHMALGENDFAAIREGLPILLKASKSVKDYKCVGYDNCPKDERKAFDRNKKELLNAVKDLKKACKGNNDAKVTASFDKMHEAYITFANTCTH